MARPEAGCVRIKREFGFWFALTAEVVLQSVASGHETAESSDRLHRRYRELRFRLFSRRLSHFWSCHRIKHLRVETLSLKSKLSHLKWTCCVDLIWRASYFIYLVFLSMQQNWGSSPYGWLSFQSRVERETSASALNLLTLNCRSSHHTVNSTFTQTHLDAYLLYLILKKYPPLVYLPFYFWSWCFSRSSRCDLLSAKYFNRHQRQLAQCLLVTGSDIAEHADAHCHGDGRRLFCRGGDGGQT